MASWKKVIVSGSQASQLSFAGTGILSGSGAITAVTDTATIDLTFAAGSLSGFVRSGSIDQGQLASNSVIAAKIANDAVTTAKILNGNVTNEKLANAAINIGSTTLTLGAAATNTITGLTSVTSTTFVGALTGTASIATKLATPRAFTTTGDVVITSTNFDGSANFTAAATIQAGSVENTMFAANAKTAISGAFTSTSSSIAADIASLEAAVGTGGTLISSSAEGDAQGQIKLNGVNVDAKDLGTGDSPQFANLTLTGNLTVQGDVTSLQTTNVNVEDQFILLNSGSGDGDAGLVINGAGSAIGWDSAQNRFALDYAGATWNQTTITSDAFVASVVTTDDPNYQKVGNIRIDGADIFIYS
jgi:hypothetical protein